MRTLDTEERFKAQDALARGEHIQVETDPAKTPNLKDAPEAVEASGIVSGGQKIGLEEIRKAKETLHKYKQGKSALEDKIKKNEQWWKMRHWDVVPNENQDDPKPASGWLFNCIMSKHADFMDSFPEPAILPREEGDEQEAQTLTSILPVILEQNDFEQVYSKEVDYKLKNGTGCYGVFWDQSKLNGLGDICIKHVDLLSLFWEPGVIDIQDSKNIFSVELEDNDTLEQKYPECKGKLRSGRDKILEKYALDENIDTSNKSLVIDWYYKKTNEQGKTVLHYAKFIDEILIYASENDMEQPTKQELVPVIINGQQVIDSEGLPMLDYQTVPDGDPIAVRGWYDHGLYPFVFDVLFRCEGLPTGFGFVDVCKSAQMSIDVYNNAIEKSLIFNANPRYFVRRDASINEEEFLDPNKIMVHVDGNLGADSIRAIDQRPLDDLYVGILNNKIEELKETSGNRDTSNGGTQSGVTAASAIAAMQEQSGKTSRDMIKTTYRAYQDVINLCIELIRQYYDMPRKFRIVGERGRSRFITYTNDGLQPEYQGNEYGVDMGFRLPVFDIKVQAQKENRYSQLGQNELALQFYNSGFFNPQFADQVLACLDMMQFTGKEKVEQRVEENGGMYQQMLMMQQQMIQMAQIIDSQNGTNMAEQMANGVLQQIGEPIGQAFVPAASTESEDMLKGGENSIVARARDRAASASEPR